MLRTLYTKRQRTINEQGNSPTIVISAPGSTKKTKRHSVMSGSIPVFDDKDFHSPTHPAIPEDKDREKAELSEVPQDGTFFETNYSTKEVSVRPRNSDQFIDLVRNIKQPSMQSYSTVKSLS